MSSLRIKNHFVLSCLLTCISLAAFSQNEVREEIVPASLKTNKDFSLADDILKEIEDSLQVYRTNPVSLLGGYHAPFRKEFDLKKKSLEAKLHFEKSLALLSKSSSEYAHCLSKLALCEHYQVDDFSHSDSLTSTYKSSIKLINQAISIHKKQKDVELLIQLYYTAAQISSPHFWWGYQSPEAAKAEELCDKYLLAISEIQSKRQNYKGAVMALRFIDSNDLNHLSKKIEFAVLAKEENSLPLAHDIRDYIHEFVYRTDEIIANKTNIEKYGPIGITAFKKAHDPDYQVSLYSDLASCYEKIDGDFERSMPLLEDAENLLLENEKSTYYIAFQLAALYIQTENLSGAKAQYELALKDEKLSPTDKEHAFFGLVMVNEFKENFEKSDEIWFNHIGDKEIMNGIASYQYRFADNFKPIIREKALVVMKRKNAKNAIRIVEEGWK